MSFSRKGIYWISLKIAILPQIIASYNVFEKLINSWFPFLLRNELVHNHAIYILFATIVFVISCVS
jgi:hypothetical protein